MLDKGGGGGGNIILWVVLSVVPSIRILGVRFPFWCWFPPHTPSLTPPPPPPQKCSHFCSEWCIMGYGTGKFGICVIRYMYVVSDKGRGIESWKYNFLFNTATILLFRCNSAFDARFIGIKSTIWTYNSTLTVDNKVMIIMVKHIGYFIAILLSSYFYCYLYYFYHYTLFVHKSMWPHVLLSQQTITR